jgi:hypothetical protein
MSALTRPARLLAASALVAATAGMTLLAGAPAYADTVTVNYSCDTPLGTQTGDVDVTVNVPATAAVGDTVTVTVDTTAFPLSVPIDLAAGSITPSADLAVSGAQSGTLHVTGPANPDPVPAGGQVQLSQLSGDLTLTAAGQTDLTPGNITTSVATIFGTFTIVCTPTAAPAVAAAVTAS